MNDQHNYSFVDSLGNNNDFFLIMGNELKTNAPIDYDENPTFQVFIKTTDDGVPNMSYVKSFIITTNDLNASPHEIDLHPTDVNAQSILGTVVGLFTTQDEDSTDQHSYEFVNEGENDNIFFIIVGDTLKTNAPIVYETNPTFLIVVRSTDNGTPNLSLVKSFIITTNDVGGVDSNMGIINNKHFILHNPVSDFLTIEIEGLDFKQFTINIIDEGGKIVYHESNGKNSKQFDVSFLKNGLYICRINCKNHLYVEKFIKM